MNGKIYENIEHSHLRIMQPKKIIYVPGLISLLGLPLLLLFFGPEDYKYKNSLRIFLPTDEMSPDSLQTKFSRFGVYQTLENKKLVQINLWDTDRHYNDRWGISTIKKIFIEREMQRLQFTNDTTIALKIEFASPNTYAEFIHVINLTIVYDIRRWAFVDNSFYLFPNPPPTNPDLFVFNDGYPISVTSEYKGPTAWQRFNWWLEEKMMILSLLLKYNYLLIPGFVLLIVIPWFLKLRSLRKAWTT